MRGSTRDAEQSRIEEGPDGGVVVHNTIPEDGPVLEDDEEEIETPYPPNSAEDAAYRWGFRHGRKGLTASRRRIQAHGDQVEPHRHPEPIPDEPEIEAMEDDARHHMVTDHAPIRSLAQLNDHNRRQRNRPTRDRSTAQPPRTLKAVNAFMKKFYAR
jgi:hypothetical protein